MKSISESESMADVNQLIKHWKEQHPLLEVLKRRKNTISNLNKSHKNIKKTHTEAIHPSFYIEQIKISNQVTNMRPEEDIRSLCQGRLKKKS